MDQMHADLAANEAAAAIAHYIETQKVPVRTVGPEFYKAVLQVVSKLTNMVANEEALY